ncbi:MAG TPA: potassium channel family protein [Gaiellaceae bacterium]|nr:potassium channel family protein [Gaiellaceae bacterium]
MRQKEAADMQFLSDRGLERVNRAVVSGRIVPYLALFTFAVAFAAALVVRIFAHNEFATFGESLWWAAQTITTVGYGDVVPQTALSKLVAVIVMIFGVSTVALITAVVTSAVVTWTQGRLTGTDVQHKDMHLDALERIEQRLEALEQRLP